MKNPCCCPVCKVGGLLVILGALNWGLVGLHHNLVSKLLGAGTKAETIVYLLIGLAGVIKLLGCFITLPCSKMCKADGKDKKEGCCAGGH